MNKTIKLLMLSDVFVLTGFGLIEPILAIFFKENLVGGTIFTAGLASTIFFITKNSIQLPFSKYVDEHNHESKWLVLGTLLIAMVPFIYILAKNIYTIYIAQMIYGLGGALAYPTWLGLWSTHLDKKHESYEWSLYSAATGIGTAITSAIGAAIAQFIGFNATFVLVGVMSLSGCVTLYYLETHNTKTKQIKLTQFQKQRKLTQKER